MNFHFNQDEQDVLDMLHDFCLKEVAPIAAEIDETERFPEETWHKLADMGMMGIAYPEEVGGAGMSYVTYIGACEELAKHCATTSVMVSAHSSLCCWPISEYGTEAQKEKYLSKLCSGEWLGAFGLTEPGAGTDAAMQKTVAEDKGDHWVLNGSKIFITNAGFANVFVVFAMTDKSLGTKGITCFIVEKDRPGVSVGKAEDKMGMVLSNTTDLLFENVRIPAKNRVGEEGRGFKIAMTCLDRSRGVNSYGALGIAQRAIDESVAYAKQRKTFGKPIIAHQMVQGLLADMEIQTTAARALLWHCARMVDEGVYDSKLGAVTKAFISDAAMQVTTNAVQVLGGYGYSREYPVEKLMRDAKLWQIFEGTNQVQRMVIAGAMAAGK